MIPRANRLNYRGLAGTRLSLCVLLVLVVDVNNYSLRLFMESLLSEWVGVFMHFTVCIVIVIVFIIFFFFP